MKKVVLVVTVLFACSSAFATSYELDCHNVVMFDDYETALLCSGAKSEFPVTCYNSVIHSPYSIDDLEVAILCSGAKSSAPFNCFMKRKNFDEMETAILCTESGQKWSRFFGVGGG